MSLEPESALLAELLADEDLVVDDLDDYEWFDATDGRPRTETIQPTGAVL